MPAVAMTDKGNLMGAFQFVEAVAEHNKNLEKTQTPLKSIVGCEFNICENRKDKSRKDNGFQVVFLAKNKKGYQNISKMSSIAFVEGYYYVPRIDKEIVKKYRENIIVLTGAMGGEIPQKILNVGDAQAEEALLWWKNIFGEDLYIELVRHGNDGETELNQKLIALGNKHNIKTVATNQVYYLEGEDANAHDILLCVKEGEQQATQIGRGRGFRYGLSNQEHYFKSADEMKKRFVDVPEAIINTQEIVDKITPFELARDVLLPVFEIPKEFADDKDLQDGGKRGENNYLKHLTYEGAKMRYGTLKDEITQRLDFELEVIEKTGYPGYFLIVYDLIKAGRDMGVSVGPGRGSAAGSVVAYCLQITNIDPIAYDLLFERFLNPERISMPDIDIDFDDKGRDKVIDYVIKKYGSSQVAQIITYGKMAAKSAIRDTARVLDLPLYDANRIAKLMPDNQKLQKILPLDETALKKELKGEDAQKVLDLKKEMSKDALVSKTVNQARILEGSLRNTGVHACGVIITPDDITEYVPVKTAKDTEMYLSQFDNSVVERAGLLKMDFLGLKTLTIIKDAVAIVRKNLGITIDPEALSLDDEKTYELFQRGDTIGIFQYESVGMQKSMRQLKPTVFEDLIAMNALYRPGPMDYIPSFIARKHGNEKIEYDLPEMEEYLKETYGITVYQEQVMLLSQKLADFTKGEADVLRKAMGKKQAAVLEKMKPKFIEQAVQKGHPSKTLEKIWKDWEAFASYAFNKSHSTCYAFIAYQTAYLKAHYPAAYMAALLSNNMSNLDEVTKIMSACKMEGIPVLGPDINESDSFFSINESGAVRFGMAAIKGVGEAATETIVKEREKNGDYKSIFDMLKRLDSSVFNKRVLDGLVLAGAFDGFKGVHRAQYFASLEKSKKTFIELLLEHSKKYHLQKNSAQQSLFGGGTETELPDPMPPKTNEWSNMELLTKEKEVVGIYISSHPLADFNATKPRCVGFILFKSFRIKRQSTSFFQNKCVFV
uniref:DNA-directed DNA polymerase n=1 Tax=Stylophora pistillata TaxID=50429 RepID=A0A2B4RC17_STYPI